MTLASALAVLAGGAAAVGLVALALYVRRIDKDLPDTTVAPSDDVLQRQAQVGIGLTGGSTMSH